MNIRIKLKDSMTYVMLIKLINAKLSNAIIVTKMSMLLYFALERKVMKKYGHPPSYFNK